MAGSPTVPRPLRWPLHLALLLLPTVGSASEGVGGGGSTAAINCTAAPADVLLSLEQTGLVSVKAFGATGASALVPKTPSQRHDDAPAIRETLAFCAACGGLVFFPPGTYYVGSTIFIERRLYGFIGLVGARTSTAGVAGQRGPKALLVGSVSPLLRIGSLNPSTDPFVPSLPNTTDPRLYGIAGSVTLENLVCS